MDITLSIKTVFAIGLVRCNQFSRKVSMTIDLARGMLVKIIVYEEEAESTGRSNGGSRGLGPSTFVYN